MKFLITIVLFAVFSLYRVNVNAQAVVNDKYQRRQMESMVITRWGKFIPKWYYILFHNKYRKGEDRRNMWQLLPAVAAVSLTEAQSDNEKEDSDQLFEQAVWTEANIEAELPYRLYFEAKFRQLQSEITNLIGEAQVAEVDPEVIHTFQSEAARLTGQIDIIREGMLTNGESCEAYNDIEEEMRKLKGMIRKYLKYQNAMLKYTRP